MRDDDRPDYRNCMRMDPTYRGLYSLHKSRIDESSIQR